MITSVFSQFPALPTDTHGAGQGRREHQSHCWPNTCEPGLAVTRGGTAPCVPRVACGEQEHPMWSTEPALGSAAAGPAVRRAWVPNRSISPERLQRELSKPFMKLSIQKESVVSAWRNPGSNLKVLGMPPPLHNQGCSLFFLLLHREEHCVGSQHNKSFAGLAGTTWVK